MSESREGRGIQASAHGRRSFPIGRLLGHVNAEKRPSRRRGDTTSNREGPKLRAYLNRATRLKQVGSVPPDVSRPRRGPSRLWDRALRGLAARREELCAVAETLARPARFATGNMPKG